MTPAVWVHPHLVRAGKAHPGADVVFSCQVINPPFCYGPGQIRAAYGIDKLGAAGLNGSGTSITIIDAYSAPAIRHDLELFDRVFGIPSTKLNIVAPQGLTPFDQSDPNQVNWSAEISPVRQPV